RSGKRKTQIMSRKHLGKLFFTLIICVVHARSEDIVFDRNAAQTEVKFTLADVLHTVHGVFQIRSGMIQYDPYTARRVVRCGSTWRAALQAAGRATEKCTKTFWKPPIPRRRLHSHNH